jgi:lipoprotein-releasing system ATP-binding protein
LSENGLQAPLLRVEGLRKVFRTGSEELTVLDGVSLQVAEGGTVVISGESGSGKSTLLHLIGGLDSPTAGRILFQGMEIGGLGESALVEYRNRRLGFIFQLHYLLKDFTALENVFMPAAIAGAGAPARRRAEGLLEQVGLGARRAHYPAELSGGERQRVAVARALMNDPQLILADEPTGSLDSVTSDHIFELFDRLVDERGKTIIMVTHDKSIAPRFSRILRIADGELAAPVEEDESAPEAGAGEKQKKRRWLW